MEFIYGELWRDREMAQDFIFKKIKKNQRKGKMKEKKLSHGIKYVL